MNRNEAIVIALIVLCITAYNITYLFTQNKSVPVSVEAKTDGK